MKLKLPQYIEILAVRSPKNNLKTIKYNNKFIHSPYDPLKEALQELDKYPDIGKYDIIVIFGLGMGYIVDTLQSNSLRPDIRIIGIEYEENFEYFFKNKTYKNPVSLFFHTEAAKIADYLLDLIDKVSLKKILFIELKPIMKISNAYYDDIKERIRISLQQKIADVTTTAYFNQLWLENSFINLHLVKHFIRVNKLKNKFTHKIALFVSSGPSAEDDIDFIKKFKGIILTLPPSVNFLIKHGVVPDFVILGDSNYNNIYHLKRSLGLNLTLITDLSAHYSILKKWKGHVILFSYNIPGFEWVFNRLKIDYIPQGGTVASSVLSLIKYMGFKNVILSGQDFAYKDFQLHVRGGGYELYHLNRINKFKNYNNLIFDLIRNNKLIYKDGKIIDHKMALYKEWFEKLIKILNIRLAGKNTAYQEKKERFNFNNNEEFMLKAELLILLEKLNNIIINNKTTVEEFISRLKNEKEVFDLIKGFNFQLFLKIERNLEVKKDEFFDRINFSLDKIKKLVNFSIEKNN